MIRANVSQVAAVDRPRRECQPTYQCLGHHNILGRAKATLGVVVDIDADFGRLAQPRTRGITGAVEDYRPEGDPQHIQREWIGGVRHGIS